MVSAGMADPANAESALNTAGAENRSCRHHALYNPTSDYLSQDWSKVTMKSQVNLASLSYETGGEAYFLGHTPPLSVDPFLADISEHLAHQYLVKFDVNSVPNGAFPDHFHYARKSRLGTDETRESLEFPAWPRRTVFSRCWVYNSPCFCIL